jgi:hypothetical protein
VSHPEVRAIMEQERAVLLQRVLAGLPPEVPRSPAVMLAVQGWGHFTEATELAWVTDGGIDRAHLRELCGRVLTGAIVAAMELDGAG